VAMLCVAGEPVLVEPKAVTALRRVAIVCGVSMFCCPKSEGREPSAILHASS
jgi:hypothetical protein